MSTPLTEAEINEISKAGSEAAGYAITRALEHGAITALASGELPNSDNWFPARVAAWKKAVANIKARRASAASEPPAALAINLNDTVEVTLTAEGRWAVAAENDRYRTLGALEDVYRVEADGRFKVQLWCLARVFHDYMRIAAKQVFEDNEIRFVGTRARAEAPSASLRPIPDLWPTTSCGHLDVGKEACAVCGKKNAEQKDDPARRAIKAAIAECGCEQVVPPPLTPCKPCAILRAALEGREMPELSERAKAVLA